MPFTRIKRGKNKGKYRSESGKIYTERQVRAYHATRGWKKKPKKQEVNMKKRNCNCEKCCGCEKCKCNCDQCECCKKS